MDIKVSIIVPVYNSEKTLVRCLSNLVNQTLQEIEIILVNDASTDHSLQIMNECKMQFEGKIKIINSDCNRGAGGARNLAMREAGGEYIGFVDSDDMVDASMYEKLYQAAKQGDYDIVDCGFVHEKEDTAIIYTSDELTGILNAEKRSSLIVSGGYIWSKIFKSSFLKNNKKFVFRENAILEDSDFLTYALASAHSIGNVKEILYKYTYEDASLSNSTKGIKYAENIYNAMSAVYFAVRDLDNYEKIKEAVEYEIIQLYSYGIVLCLAEYKNNNNNLIDYMKQMRDFRNKYVTAGYDNVYVRDKINQEDLELLKSNDKSPIDLQNKFNRKIYY